jgi:3-oxoacyl-[acyl-carrier-protein] synthase-1
MGMVNALGAGREEIWPRLLAGDQSGFQVRDDLVPGRSLLLGEVTRPLPRVPDRLRRYACRNNQLALLAFEQIETQARDALRAVGPLRLGVVMGTSTSGVGDAEAALVHKARTGGLHPAFHYDQLEFGGTAGFLADLLEATGPAYTLSTACSSGARALASARSLLAAGVCDAVLAGAADSLCGLTTNGFSALQAISDELTNPCSRNRKGLTLGEGAALFLVTRAGGGVQLAGVGESSEAHHMSAPDPSGKGAEAAMRAALADAGARPQDVAYLNLHGTGTPQNDHMECEATGRLLGGDLPCSSSKPLVGHTLGAAGAMEAGFCWLMLDALEGGELRLIPHCWDGAADPELPPLRLATKGESVPAGERALVMSNSFGFGGNNCTLVLERETRAAAARPTEVPRLRPQREATTATLRAWSAWAPRLEDAEAWRRWAGAPEPLPAGEGPTARFIPAMLRRRCTPLTRIVLTAAWDCCSPEELARARTVFASRHGSINESIELLDAIVRRDKLSPLKFSHTVHNAQAGLFSIAAGNREASSSLAAQEDTFACGWLDALAHLEREPERPVLLVMGDVPLAPTFARLIQEATASYGLALLLARGGEGERIAFGASPAERPWAPGRWPDALEFLRWLLGDAASCSLDGLRSRWTWTRG